MDMLVYCKRDDDIDHNYNVMGILGMPSTLCW
jgi:hypothetical protein